MARWKCNQGVRPELDLHTYRSSPLHQSEATPSQISTRPEHPNITGHKLLIFHSSEYRLAVNRIYTLLSMSQGVLPSPYSTAKMFSPFMKAHFKSAQQELNLWLFAREIDDMEIDHSGKSDICVSSTLDKTQEHQRWVTSCFTSLPSPSETLKPLTTVRLFMTLPPTCLLGTILLRWPLGAGEGCKFTLPDQKCVILTIKCYWDSSRTEI